MTDATSVGTGASTKVRSELGPWAEAWNELVAAAPLPTPFSRGWWLEHVSVHRPRSVLVVDGGELVGGLALEERAVAGISFVTMLGAGPLCPDHLDLLARPGYEAVAKAEVRRWLSRADARVGRLGRIVEGALVLDALPQARLLSRRRLHRCMSRRRTRIWRPGRRTSARTSARLYAGPTVTGSSRCLDPTKTRSGLIRLRELHVARWGHARFVSSFVVSPRPPCRELRAVRSRCTARRKRIHGRVRRLLRARGPHVLLSSGSTPGASVAERRHVAPLQDDRTCDRARTQRVDFLRGDEQYKRSFADAERPLLTARSNWGLGGKAAATAMGAVRRARSLGARTKRQMERRVKATGLAR